MKNFNKNSLREYFFIAVIIITCIIVFSPVIHCDLMTGWDDQWQVTNRFTESGFTWENIYNIISNFWHGQYSPINQMMYVFIYNIFEYNPLYYHITSLLLHIINSTLVFVLLKKILFKVEIIQKHHIIPIVFFTTILFSIHPLQVESVAWISASKILISTFFYLFATLCYINYLDKDKIKYYIYTIIMFILSYGCKEQVLVFPFWIMLLSVIYKCNFKSYKTWLNLVPLFVISLTIGITFLQIIDNPNRVEYPFYQRLIFACYSIVEYIIKWFIPYKLLHIYPFPIIVGEKLPNWMLIYPLIITLIVYSCYNLFKKPILLYSILFFLIHLILVLHIFPLRRPAIIADRYMYLASIGIALPVVYFVNNCYYKYLKSYRIYICTFFTLYIILISSISYNRINVWQNSKILKDEIKEIKKEIREKNDTEIDNNKIEKQYNLS